MEVQVIYSRLTADPEFVKQLRQLLDPQEQARADRFRFEKDRNAFTIARGLLRTILGGYLQMTPSAIQFIYGPRGKPAVVSSRPIRFNLSHSGDLVLYAITEGHEVGADVEHIRPMEDLDGIARRFFSPVEYLELASLPAGEKLKCFFDCWTRKESFIKAVGDGLSYPLDRFRVTLRPGDVPRLVSIDGQDASSLPWSLHDVAPCEDYAAALTVGSPTCQVYIRRFESAQECAAARRQLV
jgi:4'-phosphopantetheinyl transferase